MNVVRTKISLEFDSSLEAFHNSRSCIQYSKILWDTISKNKERLIRVFKISGILSWKDHMITFFICKRKQRELLKYIQLVNLCLRQTITTTFSNFLRAWIIFHELFRGKIVFCFSHGKFNIFPFLFFYTRLHPGKAQKLQLQNLIKPEKKNEQVL